MNRRGLFSSFFHRLFVRNLRDKLLAIVLAILLYVMLSSSGETVTVTDLPIKVELPENVVLRDVPPPVTLEVSAPQALRERLNGRNIACTVAAPTKPPADGFFKIELSPRNFQLPVGVTIKRITPQKITLRLETLVTRQVTIEPQFSAGEPAPGFRVAAVSFVPEKAEIGGPASLVDPLKAVRTEPIPLDGVSESFQFAAPLQKPGDTLSLRPATVLANVVIERSSERHTVRGLPLRLMLPGRRMTAERLTADPMEVEFIAPLSEQVNLSADDFLVYLDLTEFTEEGEFDVAPRAVITAADSKARIDKISPSPVRIRLRKLSDKETGTDATVIDQKPSK